MNNSIKFECERCPLCKDGTWRPHADGTYKFLYARKSYRVSGQHYALCDKCATRGYLPGQRAANQQLIFEFQRALPGYISPSDVLSLREKYLLTQEQAGMIFGGGKQAFSKWECGKATPAGPTARLIKLALKSPEAMTILSTDAGVHLNEQPAHNRRATDTRATYPHEMVILGEIREQFTSLVKSLTPLVSGANATKKMRGETTLFQQESTSGDSPNFAEVPQNESRTQH